MRSLAILAVVFSIVSVSARQPQSPPSPNQAAAAFVEALRKALASNNRSAVADPIMPLDY
jgi:hypothetical protein